MGLSYFLGVSYCDDRVELPGNHPATAETARPVGDADGNTLLAMQILFALRNPAALEKLLTEQQEPASANYHRWLKTGEFAGRFGPAQSEVNAISDWLVSE